MESKELIRKDELKRRLPARSIEHSGWRCNEPGSQFAGSKHGRLDEPH